MQQIAAKTAEQTKMSGFKALSDSPRVSPVNCPGFAGLDHYMIADTGGFEPQTEPPAAEPEKNLHHGPFDNEGG